LIKIQPNGTIKMFLSINEGGNMAYRSEPYPGLRAESSRKGMRAEVNQSRRARVEWAEIAASVKSSLAESARGLLSILYGETTDGERRQIDRKSIDFVVDFVVRSSEVSAKQHRKGFPATSREQMNMDALNAELEEMGKTGCETLVASEESANRARLIATSASFARKLNGQKPTVYQLLAALVLMPDVGGIAGERFRSMVNFIRYRHDHAKSSDNTYWTGSIENFYHGFNLKTQKGYLLLEQILGLFISKPSHLFASDELLELLKDEASNKKLKQFLNPLLQFLSSTGALVRHPDHKNLKTKKMVSVWSFTACDPEKPRLRSPELMVIHHAACRDGWLSDMYAKSEYPFADAEFSHHAVIHAAKELQSLGVIRIEKQVRMDGSHTRAPIARAILTDDGEKLVRPWADVRFGESVAREDYNPLRKCIVEKLPVNVVMPKISPTLRRQPPL
jgi:hypothetical protein